MGADEYVFNMPDIINFFDNCVDAGTLVGFGPGNSAENRLNAFSKMLIRVGDMIDKGNVKGACNELNKVS